MSLDEKKLLSDFESYLRGEEPSGVELATAPRLYDWTVLISKSPGDGSYRMTISGTATGHPTQHDGRYIQTSPVVWLDHRCRWARTMSRLYVLDAQKITSEGVAF